MMRLVIFFLPAMLVLAGCSCRPTAPSGGATTLNSPKGGDQKPEVVDLNVDEQPIPAAHQEAEAISRTAKASAAASGTPVQGGPGVPPEIQAGWPGTWIDELQGIVGNAGGYRGTFVGGNTMTGVEVARLRDCAKAHPDIIWKLDLEKLVKVKEAELEPLADLDHVRMLVLPANVTDAGLVYLPGMKSLENIVLFSPYVTDAGLKNLEGLKNLRIVVLPDSKNITLEGIRRLKQALPQTQINSPLSDQ